jgi:hypothetical protein
MPRKQRFKPSRKPKPVLPNEDAAMGRKESSSLADNDNAPAREALPPRDVGALSSGDTEAR